MERKIKMVKRTISELIAFSPPGHYGMTAMVYHGKEETGAEKFRVGIDTFIPGGGIEWDDGSPQEKLYYVLEGEITVIDKDGKKYIIGKDESLTILPGVGRSVVNESNYPVRMLVIANYV